MPADGQGRQQEQGREDGDAGSTKATPSHAGVACGREAVRLEVRRAAPMRIGSAPRMDRAWPGRCDGQARIPVASRRPYWAPAATIASMTELPGEPSMMPCIALSSSL